MTGNTLDAPPFLLDGLKWFIDSGIQEDHGGVARYHDSDAARNARISTEITGYAVSALTEVHLRTGAPEAIEAASRAAGFLCLRAWDGESNAMPFEWPPVVNGTGSFTYFFDNGIVVRGLLHLWRLNGEAALLETALRCGESMRRDFVNRADVHPILELPSKSPVERDARWSRTSDCYQLKSALGWLDLAEATGDDAWTVEYERVLERALKTHKQFLDKEPGVRVMDRLHAYCYFLEALLPRAEQRAVRDALSYGIQRVAAELRRMRCEFERSDVVAQLLRVRLWAEQLGAVALDEKAAAEEAAWSAAYQMRGSGNVDGSFCFGRRKGLLMPYANPVSTAFCLQALSIWDDWRSGRSFADFQSLI